MPKKVSPDAVRQAGGEVGVIRRSEPFGQHRTAIAAFQVGLGTAEEFRRHDAAAHRMRHFAAAAVENDCLTVVFPLFAADLREESREAVVVVHGPAVEGMVVALRTVHECP